MDRLLLTIPGLATAALVLCTAPVQADEGEPLTLEAAVQRALAENYSIQVHSFSLPIAEAAVSEAKGRFDPRLVFRDTRSNDERPQRLDTDTGEPFPSTIYESDAQQVALEGELPFGLGYQLSGRTSNDRGSWDGYADNHSSFAGVSARLPLLRGFGPAATLTGIRVARTNRDISEWEFRAAVVDTITEVAYVYHELVLAHASLRSARRSRELAEQLHRENEKRFGVGSMSEYDVLSARARVAAREENILLAERYVSSVQLRLKRLISDERSTALLDGPLVLAPLPPPAEMRVDIASDIAVAHELRPDFRQALLARQRSVELYRRERNQLLPGLDLVGSYGYSGVGSDASSSRGQIRDRDHPSYSAGIVLSLPITSTSERARARSARLVRERAELQIRELEQSIVVRIGEAASEIETAWKRVLASRASRDLSQQTLDSEVKRLRAGPGSTFVVLQLQEILSNDEVREARAVADFRNALAEYDRQTGRTLARHRVELAPLE
jgi:outer membrane protein TolC